MPETQWPQLTGRRMRECKRCFPHFHPELNCIQRSGCRCGRCAIDRDERHDVLRLPHSGRLDIGAGCTDHQLETPGNCLLSWI